MQMDEYLILPGCDDTNRGDQALIWETVELAKAAGFDGHYSMIATAECGRQSKTIGIDSLAYLLPHPSMHATAGEDNRSYGVSLKLKWAIMALSDLLVAFPLSKKATRGLAAKMLSDEQKRTFEVFKKAKAAFVKGGGFLHAYGGVADAYKIYFFLYHINLALSMGIPVYVMPNSYGPFVDNASKRMVQRCLSRCRLVYSRESISQEVLRNTCGVDSELSRDLAMYLEKDKGFDAAKCLNEKGISIQTGKMVGITVRPYRFPGKQNAEELYKNYKTSVYHLILWLKANYYHPVLIEHVYSENYHERDIICINEIAKMVEDAGQKVDVFSALELNCKQMKSVYSMMDYLIGTRFHSVIFSLTENVPVIAITYGGNKGDGIMKDIGLSDYAVPIDELSESDLTETFRELIQNQVDVKESLKKNQQEIFTEYNKIIAAVRKTYKEL